MDEYIKKEDVYQYLDNEVEWKVNQDRLYALELINDFPAAEVAEVRHGRWISTGVISCKCSDCGKLQLKSHADDSNYCPNCGARMDKEDEHEAG